MGSFVGGGSSVGVDGGVIAVGFVFGGSVVDFVVGSFGGSAVGSGRSGVDGGVDSGVDGVDDVRGFVAAIARNARLVENRCDV